MSEENRAVVRRLYEEVFNQINLDALDEVVASDITNHNPRKSRRVA